MFNEIENLDDINGGVAPLVYVGAVVVGIVADEVVERTTGKDICGHIGSALSAAGKFLNNGK